MAGSVGNGSLIRAGGSLGADGSETAELEEMKNAVTHQAGLNEIIMLQKQYEDLVRRNSRVLGMRRNRRILIATDSSHY